MLKLHPFEKAGLGKAPFRCSHVTENWFQVAAGSLFPGPRIPAGSCEYCGTSIAYEYHVHGSDGSHFVVGCECVKKTKAEVGNFKKVRTDFVRMKRQAQQKAKWEARRAQWAAEAAAKREVFEKENPGLLEAMKKLAQKGGFFADMVASVERYGSLTAKQLEVSKRILSEQQARAAAEAGSQWVGEEKKPLSGTFRVLMKTGWASQFYPFPWVHLFVLESGGNLFVYKGSVDLAGKGEEFDATFTVKGHGEYKGAKQTILTRPRNCSEPRVLETA